MSRLVVVSNRIAPANEGKVAAGGLAVAVLAALRQRGGVWFGWSGEVAPAPSATPRTVNAGRLTYATIDLPQVDFDEYYNGFTNRTLWPLLHYRLDLTAFQRSHYDTYLRVNQRFVDTLLPMLRDDDLVWVHDYHLIPVAEGLRHAGIRNRIGFFLHTPFPVPQILLALPSHHDLIRALCAYDVVGFQTTEDLHAFHEYLVTERLGEVHEDGRVTAFGRTLRAGAYPIGIDTEPFAAAAAAADTARQTQRLRESLGGRPLIIGVDRLDYTKGLLERFQAFERLLERYPGHRSRVVFMQIAPPSRIAVPEYAHIRQMLEAKTGRVNGRFGEFDWQPIRYLNKSFARPTLAGFARVARVALVTPLRDGMNLVAKEYVAAQRPDDPGVLVLSRFAGAAQELREALIVNPYDADEVSTAMQAALEMPLDERRARWSAMMEVLRGNDVGAWQDRFLKALAAPAGPAVP